MKKFISIWIYCLFISGVSAQDSAICYLRDADGRIREHNVDFTKMKLDVKLNPAQGKVMGRVQYEFQPVQYITDTLFLDAPGIHIQKVWLDGRETRFDTDSAGLTIRFSSALNWNRQYKLDITYEATPRKGMYFIGWNVTQPDTTDNPYYTRHQIWTQGQGVDNRFWFPCYDDVDDKMMTETIITFDSAYTVISNGELKSKKLNADGSYTWHYAMNHPMASYLVMIAIDKYAHKDYKSKNGIISRQYYYSDRPEVVAPTYRYSAEMMDYMANEFQVKYPWPTYANVPVQDFMYGAMENTTATVYGDFYQTDERSAMEHSYTGTNAHELTHQWFGDYITEYSAQHHWLHESFATYYSKQFMRQINGEAYYESVKRDEADNAIRADARDRFPVAHSHGGSARHYPKGSFVIDMIRYVVGDSVYRRCITNYLKKHAYGNVTNHDFMMAFMENAGVNLDWFFDQWIFRAGVPNYEVSVERQADRVAFYVKQTQQVDELESYFKMPIVFEVHFKDGSTSTRKEWLSHQYDTVYVHAKADREIAFTLFDPGANVLKTVTFNKSLEELKAQASDAGHMIDRYDALTAMRSFDLNLKRDFLIARFVKGDFNRNQIEIISQLANDRSPETIQLFKRALKDKDYLIRRAALEKLQDFPNEILSEEEALLSDTSYYTIEIALRKLCKLYPDKSEEYLNRVKGLLGINCNVRIAYLELKLKNSMDSTLLPELIGYTSNRYEFRTRVKAIQAIERLGFCNAELLRNLFNAALYTNNRLNNPAAKAIKSFIAIPANKEMANTLFELTPWKDWEKAALEKILN